MHSDTPSVSQHGAVAGAVSKRRGYEWSGAIADGSRDTACTAHCCESLLRSTNIRTKVLFVATPTHFNNQISSPGSCSNGKVMSAECDRLYTHVGITG